MADTNVVVLNGRLTRDPELKSLPSGSSVCNMRIAVNGSRKDNATGSWIDTAHYFDVAIFGPQADSTARHMSKGSPIGVTGRLEYREWDQDGSKRSKVEVVASNVQFLGSKNGGDPDPRSPASPVEDDSDSIPF